MRLLNPRASVLLQLYIWILVTGTLKSKVPFKYMYGYKRYRLFITFFSALGPFSITVSVVILVSLQSSVTSVGGIQKTIEGCVFLTSIPSSDVDTFPYSLLRRVYRRILSFHDFCLEWSYIVFLEMTYSYFGSVLWNVLLFLSCMFINYRDGIRSGVRTMKYIHTREGLEVLSWYFCSFMTKSHQDTK